MASARKIALISGCAMLLRADRNQSLFAGPAIEDDPAHRRQAWFSDNAPNRVVETPVLRAGTGRSRSVDLCGSGHRG